MIHSIKQDQVLQQLEQIIPIRTARLVLCIILLNHLNSSSYFQKDVVVGVVTRNGATSCTATSFYLNTGVACCQTDLCNGARANYQISIMLIVGLVVIFGKI
jgi:hypothetical protein